MTKEPLDPATKVLRMIDRLERLSTLLAYDQPEPFDKLATTLEYKKTANKLGRIAQKCLSECNADLNTLAEGGIVECVRPGGVIEFVTLEDIHQALENWTWVTQKAEVSLGVAEVVLASLRGESGEEEMAAVTKTLNKLDIAL